MKPNKLNLNIVVRTGEEACVSAEIRDGAVQSLVYLENLPRLASKKWFWIKF